MFRGMSVGQAIERAEKYCAASAREVDLGVVNVTIEALK
jgi:hypothetical protein